MTPNFIHLALCDNDFGQQLERAARLIYESLGQQDVLVGEERIQRVAADLVLGLTDLDDACKGFAADLRQRRMYLHNKLKVKFANTPPNADHDGGSVAIDRNTGYIWRY